MRELLDKLLSHPSNRKVLSYLQIESDISLKLFQTWEDGGSGFDEGGVIFMEKYGERIRKGITLDAEVDMTELGENWAMLDPFVDEEEEKLEWAWEKAQGQTRD